MHCELINKTELYSSSCGFAVADLLIAAVVGSGIFVVVAV